MSNNVCAFQFLILMSYTVVLTTTNPTPLVVIITTMFTFCSCMLCSVCHTGLEIEEGPNRPIIVDIGDEVRIEPVIIDINDEVQMEPVQIGTLTITQQFENNQIPHAVEVAQIV
jgi:hypothetical protein